MPSDTESPDHAGLRSDANRVLESISWDGSYDEDAQKIVQFGITCFARGVASQEAELATLRGDRAGLNAEVNALAGQVQQAKAEDDAKELVIARLRSLCTESFFLLKEAVLMNQFDDITEDDIFALVKKYAALRDKLGKRDWMPEEFRGEPAPVKGGE